MAKVLKMKRDQLAELGDEFDVLTDAEVTESGITLSDDEVLVVAKPAPVQSPSGDGKQEPDFGLLQSRLHTVNQESAQRRIQLKDANTQISSLQTENARLKQEAADRQTEDTKRKAKDLFTEYVKEKKLEFVSADASNDVADLVLTQVDLSKTFTKESIGTLVDGVVEKKKYFLKAANLQSTDGGRQSSQGVGDSDLGVDIAAIARDFNIPYKEQKNG